jgi:hypothetical protein
MRLKQNQDFGLLLCSLGMAAARVTIKSRAVQGAARFKMLGGGGSQGGERDVVSEERSQHLMKFLPPTGAGNLSPMETDGCCGDYRRSRVHYPR